MSAGPAGDGFYLDADRVWVPAGEAAAWPTRQGDLFGALSIAGDRWDAALLIHPTCEVAKASVRRLQVVRVRALAALADVHQRTRVVAGLEERSGRMQVAFAHTFFCPPAPGSDLDAPMWADLREVALVDREQLSDAGRAGVMSHDARVTFIRRYMYFRFRLLLDVEAVRRLEADRIRADPAFAGPRPAWADDAS